MCSVVKCILKICLLFERKCYRERENEEEIHTFHPVVHSPAGHSDWGWDRLTEGARSFFRVCHVAAGVYALGPYSATFPGGLAKSLIRNGAA